MYFEATSNNINYEINVSETAHGYRVSLKADGEEWKHHDILSDDYQTLDSAISFIFGNSSYLVDVVGSGTDYTVYTRGTFRGVKIFNEEKLLHESLKGKNNLASGDTLTSGMPGKIVKIMVNEGDEVVADHPLMIMEAMKMENEMRASHPVKIKKIHVKAGENVDSGTLLITFETQ